MVSNFYIVIILCLWQYLLNTKYLSFQWYKIRVIKVIKFSNRTISLELFLLYESDISFILFQFKWSDKEEEVDN